MEVQARHVVAVGAAVAVVSLCLPWFRIASLNEVRNVTPVTLPYLRVAAVALGVLIAVGVVIEWVYRSIALIGCVAALFFNATLVTWLLGSKTTGLFPPALLPENMTVRLGAGADIAMVGAILLMAGSVIQLVDQTWEGLQQRNTDWRVIAGLLSAGLLIAVREATWMDLSAQDFRWELTVDAIPLLGDMLLVLLLIGATAAIAVGVTPRTWAAVSAIVSGLGIFLLSLIGAIFQDVTSRAGEWVAGKAPFLNGRGVMVQSASGPYASLVAGAVLAALGVASLLLKGPLSRVSDRVQPSVPSVSPQQEFPF